VSCAYSSLQLLFKTSVCRLRRAHVTYSGAARWRAKGWLHRRRVRRKALVAAASRGGSFPQTQTRANGWDRSDLPRAVLPGRPFGGWSLNTVSTPPPRHAVSIYSTCILTLKAAGLSETHQPLPPYSRYTWWFRNTFHKTTPCIYMFISILLYIYKRYTECIYRIWKIFVFWQFKI